MEAILDKSIRQVRDLLKKGEISSVELTRFYLARIGRFDKSLGAYLKLTEETALATAADADK